MVQPTPDQEKSAQTSSIVEMSLIIILIVAFGVLVWRIIVNYQWYQNSGSYSKYRSFSVSASKGDTINLSCPTGSSVVLSSAYIGPFVSESNTSTSAWQAAWNCPPQSYYNSNYPTTKNSKHLGSLCSGESCKITSGDYSTYLNDYLASSGCSGISGAVDDILFFGSYECSPTDT